MALPSVSDLLAYCQQISDLRREVKAAKRYLDGEDNIEGALVAWYLNSGVVGGTGGGGGGSTGVTAAGAVTDWRVDVAHGSFTVGQELREYIAADRTSQWTEVGSTTVLSTAPTRANLTRAGYAEIFEAVDTGTTAITSNQTSIISQLNRLAPNIPRSVLGAANTEISITIPRPPANQRNILAQLTVGYSGGTIPAAGGLVSVDWGSGFVPEAVLTTTGPAPLITAPQQGDFPGETTPGGTVGQIVVKLAAVAGCSGFIKLAYRVGA